MGFVFLKYLKGDSAFTWIEKYQENLPTNDDNVFVANLLLE